MRNFYDVLKLNFILSSVFGYCQVTRNIADIIQSKITLMDIIVLIFWSLYNCFESYYTHTFSYTAEIFSSRIYLVGIILLDKLSVISKMSLLWIGFINRGSIQKFLKKILQVDEMVRRFLLSSKSFRSIFLVIFNEISSGSHQIIQVRCYLANSFIIGRFCFTGMG